jgi:hypothetical protein
MTLGLAAIAVAPVDKISGKLQHLDSMQVLASDKPDAILPSCQRELWQLGNPQVASPKQDFVPALWWHVEARGSDRNAFLDMVRQTLVRLGAVVWCRLELKYLWWPCILLLGPSLSEPVRRDLYDQFLQMHLCCLDSWWSEPLRALFLCVEDFEKPALDT